MKPRDRDNASRELSNPPCGCSESYCSLLAVIRDRVAKVVQPFVDCLLVIHAFVARRNLVEPLNQLFADGISLAAVERRVLDSFSDRLVDTHWSVPGVICARFMSQSRRS